MILVFDTETSGLVKSDLPLASPSQPHIVQLGAVVLDREWEEVSAFSCLIKPDGWSIEEKAQEVHGITLDRCTRYGIPVEAALGSFFSMLDTCRIAAAHNMAFDSAIMEIELARLGARNPGLNRTRLRKLCTMKIGGALSKDGNYAELARLHLELVGTSFEGRHSGLEDSRACGRVLRVMIEEGIVEL